MKKFIFMFIAVLTALIVTGCPGTGQDSVSSTITYSYSVGDTGPAGGTVFYDKGSYSNGWRYLEAAPVDQSTGIQWWNGSNTTTGATGIIIGTGSENTEAIVADQGDGSYAAKICYDLTLGGYDDWFLPSKDELKEISSQLVHNGDTSFSIDYYWTSTESSDQLARKVYSGTGNDIDDNKNTTLHVRAVHAF